MTSMSSQIDSLRFINEGSTKRKEALAKFLDLEFFEKKYKLIKDEAADLRGALRKAEDGIRDLRMSRGLGDVYKRQR